MGGLANRWVASNETGLLHWRLIYPWSGQHISQFRYSDEMKDMFDRPYKGKVEGDVCLFIALLANIVSYLVE